MGARCFHIRHPRFSYLALDGLQDGAARADYRGDHVLLSVLRALGARGGHRLEHLRFLGEWSKQSSSPLAPEKLDSFTPDCFCARLR